jgi:hypothetical protein
VRDRAPILGGYRANDRSTEITQVSDEAEKEKEKKRKSEI